MDLASYRDMTNRIVENITLHTDVIGLVAVGSMTEDDAMPDEWSDHDFYLITTPSRQRYYRENNDWLPYAEKNVWMFQETEHGVKVIYNHGHQLEFAVFDLEELNLVKTNRYRILLDKGCVHEAMEAVKFSTDIWSRKSGRSLAGQFLTNLLVGIRRYKRGEKISAHKLINSTAAPHLIALVSEYVEPLYPELMDNIDPTRRFDINYPDIASGMRNLMGAALPESAKGQLFIFEQRIGVEKAGIPPEVFQIVKDEVQSSDEQLSGGE